MMNLINNKIKIFNIMVLFTIAFIFSSCNSNTGANSLSSVSKKNKNIAINAMHGILYPLSPESIGTVQSAPHEMAITPDGHYAYVADAMILSGSIGSPNGGISMYSIDTGGILHPLNPEFVKTGLRNASIVVTPSGQYVYLSGNNTSSAFIYMYHVGENGTLSPLTTPMLDLNFRGLPGPVVITPDGKYAYIVYEDNDYRYKISIYSIGLDGVLSFLSTPIITTLGDYTDYIQSITVTPNGKYAYVMRNKKIFMYQIDSDGSLSLLSTLPTDIPLKDKFVITPDNKYAYALGAYDYKVYMYSINNSGVLSPLSIPTIRTGSDNIAITPNGKYIYITDHSNIQPLYMYSVGSNGILSSLTALGSVGAFGSYNITVTPNGMFVYVSNVDYPGNISMYGITSEYSNLKTITSFSLSVDGIDIYGCDILGQNISCTLPSGTDVTKLIGSFRTYGEYVKIGDIEQTSEVTENNFTTPVMYTVTAEDGSKTDYTVTVTIAGTTAKTMTSFSLSGTQGVITDHNIAVTVPYGTDVTRLVATFRSDGESVSIGGTPQTSGVTVNDFTNPVTYRVTAKNGSTSDYTVTVTVAKDSAKALTAFSLNGVAGTITGQNIAVKMPNGSGLTSLVATFTITGQSVSVNGVIQGSGSTPNNFTSPVTYIVTAADGSTSSYTVTVTTLSSLFTCVADGTNQCGCLTENDGSGLMWYADGSVSGKWNDWCSTTNSNCTVTGAKLAAFNAANHCGYNDWHLPSVTNPSDNSYISQVGGEWGTLATYAKNNGFKNGQPLQTWLNNNQFKGVQSGTYWSSFSYNTNYVWDVVMYKERVSYDYTGPTIWGVLLVRGGQ